MWSRTLPFDVLGEGLVSEKSRNDKMAIELFVASVREWEERVRGLVGASADAK